MARVSTKPVLMTEYGVDAYHDVCGTNPESPCFNTLGDTSGSYEDQKAQSEYGLNLTKIIANYSSAGSGCTGASCGKKGEASVSSGGFLMSWVDE